MRQSAPNRAGQPIQHAGGAEPNQAHAQALNAIRHLQQPAAGKHHAMPSSHPGYSLGPGQGHDQGPLYNEPAGLGSYGPGQGQGALSRDGGGAPSGGGGAVRVQGQGHGYAPRGQSAGRAGLASGAGMHAGQRAGGGGGAGAQMQNPANPARVEYGATGSPAHRARDGQARAAEGLKSMAAGIAAAHGGGGGAPGATYGQDYGQGYEQYFGQGTGAHSQPHSGAPATAQAPNQAHNRASNPYPIPDAGRPAPSQRMQQPLLQTLGSSGTAHQAAGYGHVHQNAQATDGRGALVKAPMWAEEPVMAGHAAGHARGAATAMGSGSWPAGAQQPQKAPLQAAGFAPVASAAARVAAQPQRMAAQGLTATQVQQHPQAQVRPHPRTLPRWSSCQCGFSAKLCFRTMHQQFCQTALVPKCLLSTAQQHRLLCSAHSVCLVVCHAGHLA